MLVPFLGSGKVSSWANFSGTKKEHQTLNELTERVSSIGSIFQSQEKAPITQGAYWEEYLDAWDCNQEH